MAVVMKVLAPQAGVIIDTWVLDCDVDARQGLGQVTVTANPAKAKRFQDAGAALEFWKRPSTVRPTRDDGKPNRPLTAYTVEMQTVP